MIDLRVLTLNTWCPPFARHRELRAAALADEILRLAPDAVCLQEMFLAIPREIVIRRLEKTYPYWKYFPSGVLGSGLLTLSRDPIIKLDFLPFTLYGKAERLEHGDYLVHKGVGFTRIQRAGNIFDLYNTHTHAQYEPHNDNEYAFFTNSNLLEVAQFIQHHSATTPAILCGDLNTRPDQLGYRVITEITPLRDLFASLHPRERGITFSKQNPYVTEADQRLDYIMTNPHVTASSVQITHRGTLGATAALAYSDHYGLMATLSITDQPITISADKPAKVLDALQQEARREQKRLHTERRQRLQAAVLLAFATLDMLQWLIGLEKYRWLPTKTLRRLLLLMSALSAGAHAFVWLVILPQRAHHITQASRQIEKLR